MKVKTKRKEIIPSRLLSIGSFINLRFLKKNVTFSAAKQGVIFVFLRYLIYLSEK